MTIVFADPIASLTVAGIDSAATDRASSRRSRPFGTAAARSADARPGTVRHGISAALGRMARSIDPSVKHVATAR